jgi:outer membrane receptor for ferrienterochelin and colicins
VALLANALLATLVLLGSRPDDVPAPTLIVEVRSEEGPVAAATVRVGGHERTTDSRGRVALSVAPGEHAIVVEAPGFLPGSVNVSVPASGPTAASVTLERLEEEVFVTATRSATRLQDQPLRVELIDQEEIEEKAMMTPGNVAMLLGETTGLRVQTTAPSLGASNVRIQGLRGHYSQLLADGLPLYGAQGDSFSLMQIPPLDLSQVEVIKGAASALYGPAALGGIINLVSRRPRHAEEELLLNATSLEGVDATGWLARVPGPWAWSAIGGYHGQARRDVDGDGWTDVAGYQRGILRPRVSFDNERGTSLLATAGVVVEDRQGGTVPGGQAPDGAPFAEALDTRHADLGAVGKWLAWRRLVSVRGSFLHTGQDRTFGTVRERGTHRTGFLEASVSGRSGRHAWVVGGAFQDDRYEARDLPQFDYAFAAPALFVQDEIAFSEKLVVATSARTDLHSEYGSLVSPRASLLLRAQPEVTIRISGGAGAFAPTPFDEDTEATGLARVQPLSGLEAERAFSGSGDVSFRRGGFDLTATLFGSEVRRPTQLQTLGPSSVGFVNAPEPTRTWGTELLAGYRKGEFSALLTHAFTRSTEWDADAGQRREVPLTPRHAASFNVIYESAARGRLGIEVYYVGRQELDDDPYLASSKQYLLIGALAQRRLGKLRLFVNVENLFDVQQTNEAPLILPERRPDGRWTVDAWAPLDGRVWNGGFRVVF